MKDSMSNVDVARILVNKMGAYDEVLSVDFDGYIIARCDNNVDIVDWVMTEEPIDVDIDNGMCRHMFEQLLDKCMTELDLPCGCNIGYSFAQIHVRGDKAIIKLLHHSSMER